MTQTAVTIVQEVLTLKRKTYLSPHYLRLVFTGKVETFREATLGDNNKIFVPPQGQDKVHLKTWDAQAGDWVLPPEEVRPIIRTYTLRALDLEQREMTIDFVDHGDEGPASRWAQNVRPGGELGVAMKLHKKELFPVVDHYVLVGDATAIPVLGVILEQLPPTARGHCLIEVHGPEDELPLETRAQIDFGWLHHPTPGKDSPLVERVKGLSLPQGNRFAFVACEFASVKEIRQYFRKEKGWTKEELYAFSYWKRGAAEDQSAVARREERQGD